MKRVHTIPAFFHTETEDMLKVLEDKEIDTSKCYLCGTAIVKTQRDPLYLRERWDAWRHGKKFYDWNISGVSGKGVICESLGCLSRAQEGK